MKLALWSALALFAAVTSVARTQSTDAPNYPRMMGPGMMGGRGMMGRGMTGSMIRHHQAMMYGIPAPYRSMHDPLPATAVTLERGAQVFAQNCAACHGPTGHGDGPAGKQLVPPPANLAWLSQAGMHRSDQYIYWTVAEGGQPLGTAMPAFKNTLSQKDIWAVAGYIRDGLGRYRRR